MPPAKELNSMLKEWFQSLKNGLIVVVSVFLALNGFLMVFVATLQIVSRAMGHPVAWTVETLTLLGLYSIIPGGFLIILCGKGTIQSNSNVLRRGKSYR